MVRDWFETTDGTETRGVLTLTWARTLGQGHREARMVISYQRRIPIGVQGNEDGDYIRPKEFVDPDEDSLIALARDAVVADTRRLPKHAGKDDAAFHEPHWGHSSGLLQGTLAIDRIEALPAQFRVGLFERNQVFPVVCRPNLIHDKKQGFSAGRMAVKVHYPQAVPNVYATSGEARELDLLLAEGSAEVNGIGHTFFVRDARQLVMLTTLSPPSMKTVKTLMSFRNLGMLARVMKAVKRVMAYTKKPPSSTTGWAGKAYFSAGPYALGDGAMKFCLRPRQGHPMKPDDSGSGELTQRQRAAMQAWVAAGTDATFDLCVQLATPACIPSPGAGDPPKSVMAAEYCDLSWDEAASPYLAVGTLTFPANAQSDLSGRFPWSPLQFNAWNTLPTMRPLGQLFRVRRHVHKAHSEVRLEHLYGAEPGAMVDKAPFPARDT